MPLPPSKIAKFNHWTVVDQRPFGDLSSKDLVNCRCRCGKVKSVRKERLTRGRSRCCGCFKKHGMCKTKEYRVWTKIKERCYNPRAENYPRYGGRGVSMCDEWRNSFETFLKDMGECPIGKMSIDRIDNGGNYNHGNCRWADAVEQNNNKENTLRVTIGGVTKSLADWADDNGLKYTTVYRRFKLGWTPQDCLMPRIHKGKGDGIKKGRRM